MAPTPSKLIAKKVVKPRKKKEPDAPAPDIDVEIRHRKRSHLMCRDFSHAWEWSTDMVGRRDPETKSINVATRVLVCLRCGTERYDEFAVPSFVLISRSYSYADDYLIPGIGAIKGDVVRAEIYRRMKNKSWDKERDAS